MPLVPRGNAAAPPHLLFRRMCSRLEAAHGSRLSSGTSPGSRPRCLCEVRNRYSYTSPRHAPSGFRCTQALPQRLGPHGEKPEVVMGCRPHCAGCGRWRTMRSREYANALPEMSSRRDRRPAGTAESQGYFLKSRSNASRASIALRGAGVLMLGTADRPFCCPETSRATVTRGENSVHSFA